MATTNYFEMTSTELTELQEDIRDRAAEQEAGCYASIAIALICSVFGLFTPIGWVGLAVSGICAMYSHFSSCYTRDEAENLDWYISYQMGQESVARRF